MIDEFADVRLPDLPNAGYSTRRQRLTSDEIMIFMRATERDRLRLLDIVCEGLDKWRKVAGKALHCYRLDRDVIDAMYRYFVMQAGDRPAAQRAALIAMQQPR